MYQYINVLFELFQTYVLAERYKDMLVDGWKWRSAGSCQRPRSEAVFRKSIYYFHGKDGIEKNFQRHVIERLDREYVYVIIIRQRLCSYDLMALYKSHYSCYYCSFYH